MAATDMVMPNRFWHSCSINLFCSDVGRYMSTEGLCAPSPANGEGGGGGGGGVWGWILIFKCAFWPLVKGWFRLGNIGQVQTDSTTGECINVRHFKVKFHPVYFVEYEPTIFELVWTIYSMSMTTMYSSCRLAVCAKYFLSD